jgi:hypothetical protein
MAVVPNVLAARFALPDELNLLSRHGCLVFFATIRSR